jgi:glycosyltransferase involved in cell wall biosynthesis
MKISVLTPTYNRAHTLPELYRSLIVNSKQHSDVEWLIMDDGSSDNTEELVHGWIKENKITIKYFKQENQGKMVALNNLLEHISGEITIECDSDDYFTENCFKDILRKWPTVKDDHTVYGMALLRVTPKGKTIGTPFKESGQVSKLFDLYFKEGVEGDKCLVFKSDIRKQFKHKLEGSERFTTEGRMYHQMDLHYRGLKCFNIPAVVCEYLEDGYTKNILNIFKKSPKGHYHYYLEMFNFDMNDVPLKKRLHIIKHYILFSCLTKRKKADVINKTKGITNKILVTLLVIPGYIATKKRFK